MEIEDKIYFALLEGLPSNVHCESVEQYTELLDDLTNMVLLALASNDNQTISVH